MDPKLALLDRIASSLTLVLKYCGITLSDVINAFTRSFARVEIPDQQADIGEALNPDRVYFMTSLLTRWRSSPNYVDDMGTPLTLPERGSPPSLFTLFDETRKNLVTEHSHVDFETCKSVLCSHGCLSKNEDGNYSILNPYFRYSSLKRGSLGQLNYIAEFVSTVAHNTYEGQGGRFHITTRQSFFPEKNLSKIYAMLNEQGIALIESLDFLIESEASNSQSVVENTRTVAVGIYLAETNTRDSPSDSPNEYPKPFEQGDISYAIGKYGVKTC